MPYLNIGRYQVSVTLLLIVFSVTSSVLAAAYCLWSTKTIPVSVDEPLTVTAYPYLIHVHPGENTTLYITIHNSANISYSITLVFTLNDTAYQNSYVQFSNYTYTIAPNINDIEAWMAIDAKAPPAWLQLKIDFYRE